MLTSDPWYQKFQEIVAFKLRQLIGDEVHEPNHWTWAWAGDRAEEACIAQMDVPSLEQRAARMSSDPLKRLLAEYRDLIESYWAEESAV